MWLTTILKAWGLIDWWIYSDIQNSIPNDGPKTSALTDLHILSVLRLRFAEIKELDLAALGTRTASISTLLFA